MFAMHNPTNQATTRATSSPMQSQTIQLLRQQKCVIKQLKARVEVCQQVCQVECLGGLATQVVTNKPTKFFHIFAEWCKINQSQISNQ